MKVLTTSTSDQTLKIIPREYVSTVTLKLRDDSTNEVTTLNDITTSTDKDYMLISYGFNLVEGHFYDLTILSGSNIIYLDKIFCTDQTIDQDTNNYYSVNKDEYVSKSGNNDFIIL
jgi:hypothetical protein